MQRADNGTVFEKIAHQRVNSAVVLEAEGSAAEACSGFVDKIETKVKSFLQRNNLFVCHPN